jgi:hypothetical protein
LQLTAVSTLAALLDDWAFEEKAFAEFVGPVLGQIMTRVLKDTKELDSHTQVGRYCYCWHAHYRVAQLSSRNVRSVTVTLISSNLMGITHRYAAAGDM